MLICHAKAPLLPHGYFTLPSCYHGIRRNVKGNVGCWGVFLWNRCARVLQNPIVALTQTCYHGLGRQLVQERQAEGISERKGEAEDGKGYFERGASHGWGRSGQRLASEIRKAWTCGNFQKRNCGPESKRRSCWIAIETVEAGIGPFFGHPANMTYRRRVLRGTITLRGAGERT